MREVVLFWAIVIFCGLHQHQVEPSPLIVADDDDHSSSVMRMASGTNPTTTTPNWNAICKDLCREGNGGSLCNCEILPVAWIDALVNVGKNFARHHNDRRTLR